jgi:hypothetical protein
MFIFNRPFAAVAAGLAVALAVLCFDRACDHSAAHGEAAAAAEGQLRLVPRSPLAVSSAPVRDLSLSCRLPPAVASASWLPSLKSRIVPDQVAVCAPTIRAIFGMRSC